MATIADVVLHDNSGTALTYLPVKSGEISEWRTNDTTQPAIWQRTIRVSAGKIDKKSGLRKCRLTIEIPVLENISGTTTAGYTAAAKVAYTLKVDTTYFIPIRASGAEALTLFHYSLSALNPYLLGSATSEASTAQIKAAIIYGTNPY